MPQTQRADAVSPLVEKANPRQRGDAKPVLISVAEWVERLPKGEWWSYVVRPRFKLSRRVFSIKCYRQRQNFHHFTRMENIDAGKKSSCRND